MTPPFRRKFDGTGSAIGGMNSEVWMFQYPHHHFEHGFVIVNNEYGFERPLERIRHNFPSCSRL